MTTGSDAIVRLAGSIAAQTAEFGMMRWLLDGDVVPGTAMTLGEVPPSRALDRLRSRRSELGLPAGDDAPLLIEPLTGAPVTETALPLHLRKAKVTRISIEANSGICRGMLRHRYNNTQGQGETVPSADSDS